MTITVLAHFLDLEGHIPHFLQILQAPSNEESLDKSWPALYALPETQPDVQLQNSGCTEHVKKILPRSLRCSAKEDTL